MSDHQRYVTKEDGERLDRIAKAIYGGEGNGAVEALLDATPGLAARGPLLPKGTRVNAPLQAPAKPAAIVRPWD